MRCRGALAYLRHYRSRKLGLRAPLTFDSGGTDATCGSAQTPFSGDAMTTALQGAELRVAFCANTGGWLGSYPNSGSASAQYFNGTVGWSGPAVDFFFAVQQAAGTWHQGLSCRREHWAWTTTPNAHRAPFVLCHSHPITPFAHCAALSGGWVLLSPTPSPCVYRCSWHRIHRVHG